jgi:N-formylglutamate amidohydrolase
MNEALSCLRAAGFQVARNDPYAGGYSTIRHGHPVKSRHALQIEINRSLYMVEGALTQRACFSDIADSLSQLVERLVSVTTSLARSAYSRQ